MCQHGATRTLLLPTPDHEDRHGLRYKMRLWPVDSCIADIVQALASGGVLTTGSCCGHGERQGEILLADGRAIVITTREAAIGSGLPHAQPMTWEERRAETESAHAQAMYERVREALGLADTGPAIGRSGASA